MEVVILASANLTELSCHWLVGIQLVGWLSVCTEEAAAIDRRRCGLDQVGAACAMLLYRQ